MRVNKNGGPKEKRIRKSTKFAEWRRRSGLTLHDISVEVGVSETLLFYYETHGFTGKNEDLPQLIAKKFGANIIDLVNIEDVFRIIPETVAECDAYISMLEGFKSYLDK